ncbi:MAG: potassium transporter TrkG [Bdellovibrionota bacterium]|nr:potassium transporter TrkG [Bdellovibrionota bacterium]
MRRLSAVTYLFVKNKPAQAIFIGYFTYIVLGWIALSIPFFQNLDLQGIDNLFIAASAVSTTGLVTIDIASSYNIWGQIVVLLLFQAGGLGYMTFSSFVAMSVSSKLSKTRETISKTAFSLPEDFEIRDFLKNVVIFTFASELIGSIWLYFCFVNEGIESPLWNAIFHSVSAFCTAGFSLFPNGFAPYRDSVSINFILSLLSYFGAIGFIVFADFVQNFRGKRKNLLFTSKLILSMTFWISFLGTILIFVTEPSIQSLPTFNRLMASFFQMMTASTTVGFNTLDIGALSNATLVVLTFAMIFGASPSGTGGGLKSTTLSALIGLVKSILKGRNSIRFWKRDIPLRRLHTAVASFVYYIFVLFTFLFLLTALHPEINFFNLLFEAASALGTVGISMGITGDLNFSAKVLFIILMLMGRVGILSFGIALSSHDETRDEERDNDLVL